MSTPDIRIHRTFAWKEVPPCMHLMDERGQRVFHTLEVTDTLEVWEPTVNALGRVGPGGNWIPVPVVEEAKPPLPVPQPVPLGSTTEGYNNLRPSP